MEEENEIAGDEQSRIHRDELFCFGEEGGWVGWKELKFCLVLGLNGWVGGWVGGRTHLAVTLSVGDGLEGGLQGGHGVTGLGGFVEGQGGVHQLDGEEDGHVGPV